MVHCLHMFPVLKSHCLQLGLLTSVPGVFCLIPSCPYDRQPASGVGAEYLASRTRGFFCSSWLPNSRARPRPGRVLSGKLPPGSCL